MLLQFGDRLFFETVGFVRQAHAQHYGLTLSEDDVLDISVSYDGTWHTRGHTSHIGAGCVIDLLTGMCIDAYVVCNYCQTCETTGKPMYRNRPMEYAAWLAEHIVTCKKNSVFFVRVFFFFFFFLGGD